MLQELPLLRECSVRSEVLSAAELAQREPALKPTRPAAFFFRMMRISVRTPIAPG